MTSFRFGLSAVAVLAALPAAAEGPRFGDASIAVTGYEQSVFIPDFTVSSLGLRGDFAGPGGWGLQGDLFFKDFDTGDSAAGFALHAYRDVSRVSKFGPFIEQQWLDDGDYTTWGLESLSAVSPQWLVEVRIGSGRYSGDLVDSSIMFIGGRSDFALTPRLSFQTGVEYWEIDNPASVNLAELTLGATYAFGDPVGNPVTLGVEIGRVISQIGIDDAHSGKAEVRLSIPFGGGSPDPRDTLFAGPQLDDVTAIFAAIP